MMRHAPAGRRIQPGVFRPRVIEAASERWSTVPARYFDSGTSALAVAIGEAVVAAGGAATHEVMLPAYACPNLVAATEFAGARHHFVDFAAGGSAPAFDGAGNLAVAVDFCGVPSPGISPALIHDMAQSYAPFLAGWAPRAGRTVVSFGRAKPVSLTLGGALLGDPGNAAMAPPPASSAAVRRRAQIYNLSLDPRVFGVLARLPFLGIGTTHYQPLGAVNALDADFAMLAAAAVREFRRQSGDALEGTRRALRFAVDAGLTLPFDASDLPADLPLWRLPVLLGDATLAETFANAAASFGVSRLYRRTLPEFLGVKSGEARERWPHAWHLSRTLVTLPTHGRLTETDWQRLRLLLDKKKRNGS